MSPLNSTSTRKRGRPPKYQSAEERQAAKITRQRNQRQAAQAAKRNTFFDEYYSAGPSATGERPIALVPGIAALSVTHELEELLPPLSPDSAPLELEDSSILIDEPPLELNSLEPAASPTPNLPETVPDRRTVSTSRGDLSNLENRKALPQRLPRIARMFARWHACWPTSYISITAVVEECHEQACAAHQETHSVHTGLGEYVDQINIAGDFPDVLGSATIAARESNLAQQVTKARKQQIYCGIDPHKPDESPTHLCVAADHRPDPSLGVTVDIDSVGGFVSSLAVARRGIRWHPTQMAVSDLQSSLHIDPVSVQYFDSTGQAHHVRRPVHQVPHYTFGRLIGFEDISLYLLFPRLYREDQQSSRLLDQDFQQWTDEILLPIINRCYSGDLIQHYPSSFDHSRLNATARGVEMRSQRVDPIPREQLLAYFLPPEALPTIWEQILEATHRPGCHQFQDLKILIEGKNLKTLTKADTLADLMAGFQQHWQNAINEDYLAEPFFYDLGKETCPTTASERERPPQSLLWRRCCLNAYSQWIHSKQPADAPHALQHFYPISMLEDTGSLTLETRRTSPQRRAGLYYSQFYASVKEVFAAGNTYPFTNTATETLALDPQLRKTWQTVGGGLSHNPIALNRAYLTTKQRCHAALQGSVPKVFGLREEHRVSHALFCQILHEFQTRQQSTTRFLGSGDRVESYYALPTLTLLRWFRWNINKFCVGFEMVYSLNDRHFVTWEHTRQFGYGWFLEKIDWEMMVFRQPATQYIQFNNPSLQAAYHARYSQVRDVRTDFIRISQIHQWMTEFSSIPTCQDYLQKYLRQLCLRAFRKDVFTQIKRLLKPESVTVALAGETPLCWPSLEGALQAQHCPPYIASGNRMAVKHINVLFTWLWEWRDGRFERKGWDHKPYRLLYQKSFEVITLIQGKDAARQWKQGLKDSFIQSHWMLPYPQNNSFMRKSKESGQVMWWSSVHRGMDLYYHELNVFDRPFPASYIKHHPTTGWSPSQPSLAHLDYTIEPEQRLLHLSDPELYQTLRDLQSQWTSLNRPPQRPVHQSSRVIFENQERIQNPFDPITGPVET
ncbi:predicted protein, partial [Aspergillus terreus NIH2624]